MADQNAVVPADRNQKRSAALLKAIGLDRVPEEQRELALNIAKRYDLDLMLKHLVLVDGRPYITRDGLLHVAHRSGQLDGIEVSQPELVDQPDGKFWTVTCAVYRKDMTRPFTYAGRYPIAGQNKKYAPEMATKVAEVMAMRRAFDVSAPVVEERWERVPTEQPDEPAPSLAAQVAARRAEVLEPVLEQPAAVERTDGSADSGDPTPAPDTAPEVSPPPPASGAASTATERCDAFNEEMGGRCNRMPGHKGNHMATEGSWRQ